MLIDGFLAQPLSGAEIEARSLALIDALCPDHGLDAAAWAVARRLVHTSGDPAIVADLRFGSGWLDAGRAALAAGAPILCDARMVQAGISLARLRRVNPAYGPGHLHCRVDDAAVAAQASQQGLPRALFAMRALRPLLPGAICCLGNAPVGLMELSRLIAVEGLRPALVIAMPVGFVHVVESKEELMTLGVPYIAIRGRRGGSPCAVAALHALCQLCEAAP